MDKLRSTVLGLSLIFASSAWAGIVSFDDNTATFSTTGQSMWGSGDAATLDVNRFLGNTWSRSSNVDLMTGSRTYVAGRYKSNAVAVTAWEACNFVTIGNCGSRPPDQVWEPGYYDDNRRGFAGTADTSLRAGIEVGLSANSGSIDSDVAYNVALDVPDDIQAGSYTTLTGSSNLIDGSVNSTFPTLQASLAVVAEASATFRGTACNPLSISGGSCSVTSKSTGTIGGTQEIISLNENGEGSIEYFDGNPILNALVNTVTDPNQGFPITQSSPIASSTIYLPQPNVAGELRNDGSIGGSAQDDLFDYALDVDNIVASAAGVPGLFGGSYDFGIAEVGYNLLDVKVGPQLDLQQSFDFTPKLYVDLDFSQTVDVLGLGSVTELNSQLWEALPQIAFTEGITAITPTLYLGYEQNGEVLRGVDLMNELFLDVDGNLTVRALEAWATVGFSFLSGTFDFGIGEIFNESIDFFTSPALFSKNFGLDGFNDFMLSTFSVATQGYTATSVPEPGSLALLMLGLLALVASRRQVRGGRGHG